MLRQQVNLYRAFTTPFTTQQYLTWKRYWILNGIFLLFLIIVYFYTLFQNKQMQHKATVLQTQLASYQAEFKKLKDSFPQLFFSEDINDAVTGLKKQMAAQKNIISILSRHTPFSDVLMALSRTIIPNVWLTDILIDKDSNEITLEGESIGMKKLNDFQDSLVKDKAFEKYAIVVNEVNNSDVNNVNVRLKFQIKLTRKANG